MSVGCPAPLKALLLLALCGSISFAQTKPTELPPKLRQKIEALLRSKVEFPAATSISYGPLGPSELPGYEKIPITYNSQATGAHGELSLLVSLDGAHVAQLTTYDIASDPRSMVPSEGRPARGGTADAPVIVVGFDDLECPFCGRLHGELFPSLVDHYKDQVRVVYQSFPSDGHPWAMHAAVDTDCLAQESPSAYWTAVDTIHAHAAEYGGPSRKLDVAEQEIDKVVANQGKQFNVDEAKLNACMVKQDTTKERATLALGDKLGVDHTPTLFINGAKTEGAVPIEFIFDLIDNALRSEGKIPPPRQAISSEALKKQPDPAHSAF